MRPKKYVSLHNKELSYICHMEKDEKLTYSAALGELEKILSELRSENCDIDTLAARVRRATELISLCRGRLTRTEEELSKVLSELDGALKV